MTKTVFTITVMAFTASSFADTFIVTANSTSWSPDVANVAIGDIIRFEYGTGYPHTITSGSGCTYDGLYFNAELNSPGDYYEFEITSDLPDEIPFFCDPHCKMGMTGTIVIDHPQGHMGIGLVNISNPDVMEYTFDSILGTASIAIVNDSFLGSSFAIGVEVESSDVDVEIDISGVGEAYMLQLSTGSDTLLASGTYTLSVGERYMFHGSTIKTGNMTFVISWPETGSETGPNMDGVQLQGTGSVNSSGDSFALYAAEATSYGVLTIESDVESEMFLGNLGDVTCSTLSLPASGEEATIIVPVGTHLIEVTGLGMLWIPETGGDGGSGMAEDVTGDGVVDVSDLLAVISAWGATSP